MAVLISRTPRLGSRGVSGRGAARPPLATLVAAVVLMMGFAIPSSARADRLKELATVRGVTSNALVGYGLVVGLAGTGDNLQSVQTQKMMANVLSRRFGTNITPAQIRAQNVAVVMVTSRLPPFSRVGRRLDVTVSSASNAKSLLGGTLLPTALKGGSGATFAWAEGALTVGGFSASGGSGSSVTRNHPTVGQVPGGAVVAKELNYRLDPKRPLTIALNNPDFTTAARVAKAINARLGANVAAAADPGTIRIQVPPNLRKNLVGLVATIENIEVIPDQRARVIVNERTGTVVMGTQVRISACAISHGGLTVQISESPAVSQPNPLADGETVTVPQSEVEIVEDTGDIKLINPGPTLGDVVHALNALGVRPRDLVAILMAMSQAGALRAEIEIQ
ncbi:MAG: flagellar basal body P-ring protein FlgI [Myxococcales bacterium FL481]|nr:MAG: flagellar basal body P-ring protein FlgI [Myxococcales bacterium FL481]